VGVEKLSGIYITLPLLFYFLLSITIMFSRPL